MGLYGASLWSHSLTHDIDSASHSARLRLEQTAGGAAAIRSSLLGQLLCVLLTSSSSVQVAASSSGMVGQGHTF